MRTIRQAIHGQNLVTVTPDATVFEAARIMSGNHCGAVPVIDRWDLVGVFTERDLLVRVVARGLDARDTVVGKVMTRDPATVTPDRPVVHALHIMNDGGFRHVPVMEGNRLIGMLSIRDALGRELDSYEQDCHTKEAITQILA